MNKSWEFCQIKKIQICFPNAIWGRNDINDMTWLLCYDDYFENFKNFLFYVTLTFAQ